MDDGVDPTRGDHLCDHGIADVGAYEIGPTQVVTRRDHIEPDHLDVILGSERADERAPRSRETPVTRTTRFMAIMVQPRGYLPARRRWIVCA